MKSQLQNKKNDGLGELLITLNKIIRNKGNYEQLCCNYVATCCSYKQSSQNNQCPWCSPLKYGKISKKKLNS